MDVAKGQITTVARFKELTQTPEQRVYLVDVANYLYETTVLEHLPDGEQAMVSLGQIKPTQKKPVDVKMKYSSMSLTGKRGHKVFTLRSRAEQWHAGQDGK